MPHTWLQRALALHLEHSLPLRPIVDAAARCGAKDVYEDGLARLEGRDRDFAVTIEGAARYDAFGRDGLSEAEGEFSLTGALSRAARAGALSDVGVFFDRIGNEDLRRNAAERFTPKQGEPIADAMAWLRERELFSIAVIEEGAAQGIVESDVPKMDIQLRFACAVSRGLFRDLEGIEPALSFLARLDTGLRNSAVSGTDALLLTHPDLEARLLALPLGKDAKDSVRATAAQGRARLGDRAPLQLAISAKGMARARFVLASFTGYVQGGHLQLAEECIALTDASQLGLRIGILAAAFAVGGEWPKSESLLTSVRGQSRPSARAAVVKALGEAEEWEGAETFARADKASAGVTAPIVAWGRARLEQSSAVEALVDWTKPRDRAFVLEAAAFGAKRLNPWCVYP